MNIATSVNLPPCMPLFNRNVNYPTLYTSISVHSFEACKESQLKIKHTSLTIKKISISQIIHKTWLQNTFIFIIKIIFFQYFFAVLVLY